MAQKKGKKRKKKKQKKVIIRVYLCLILLLGVAAVYIWRSNYYKIHFYKDTWINGQDCSDKTASEVKELLQEKISEYTLNITTKEGETYTVTGPQFHLTYVDDNGVDQLLTDQNHWSGFSMRSGEVSMKYRRIPPTKKMRWNRF